MNTSSVSVVQGDFSRNLRNVSVLRNGAVVTARVISQNGDGSYSVSLAGQKITVRSEANLVLGETFSARVSVKGDVVRLSLLSEKTEIEGSFVQKMAADEKVISPKLAEFLSSLGFEPNAESLKIFQFMQQVGMKINLPAAKKALQFSKKSGEPNEEKAQISLLLEEKGIKSSDERVNAILGRNPNGNDSEQRRKNQNQEGNFLCEDEFFKSKLESDVKSYFSSVDSAAFSRKNGILSAFNTVLSSSKSELPLRHWLIFPFEWDFKNSFGTIRLLFDSDLKNLEKLVINVKTSEKSEKSKESESEKIEKTRIFALDFKNNSPVSVKFASDFEASESGVSEETILSSLFANSVRVEKADFDSLCGFCAGDEEFSFVSGVI